MIEIVFRNRIIKSYDHFIKIIVFLENSFEVLEFRFRL